MGTGHHDVAPTVIPGTHRHEHGIIACVLLQTCMHALSNFSRPYIKALLIVYTILKFLPIGPMNYMSMPFSRNRSS